MNSKQTKRNRRHIRIRARVSGTTQTPRLIVFRSIRYMYAQLVDDTTGKILAAAHDMKMETGTKSEKAKLVGQTIGEKAIKSGITSCVFDRNGYKYHGRVQAVADGAREAGLKF